MEAEFERMGVYIDGVSSSVGWNFGFFPDKI